MTAATWAGRALAGLAAFGGLVALLPMPTFLFWMGRFAFREGSLGLIALALLGAALARDRVGSGLAIVGGVAGLVLTVPLVAVARERGVRFDAREYLTGVRTPPVAVTRDLVLDAGSGLVCDRYAGVGPAPRPFVIVIHGGSWRHGDKGEVSHVSRSLAAAGITVFDLRYRLVPEHPFPAAVADVKCAHARISERASELGVDPGRVAYLGRSAGGQVALLAAYSAGDPRIPPSCGGPDLPVRKVVSIYAPTDLAWCHANPFVPDVVDGTASLELYLGGPPGSHAEAYALGTPQSFAASGARFPPALVIHGTGDRLVRPANATRLASALEAASQPHDVLLLPTAEHGFDVRPGGLAEQIARRAILHFLRDL